MSNIGGMSRGVYEQIEAKTADYQVKKDDLGKLFTNRGATAAVNFTLPKKAELLAGWNCRFFVVADYGVTVTAGDADTLVVFNDAAADSIAFSTTSEIIGAGVEVIYDGTGWLCFVTAGETQTPTIVTA